jgi:hypothetical protein
MWQGVEDLTTKGSSQLKAFVCDITKPEDILQIFFMFKILIYCICIVFVF